MNFDVELNTETWQRTDRGQLWPHPVELGLIEVQRELVKAQNRI